MTDEPIWVPRRVFQSNQVTIPADLLKQLRIEPGDVVYVSADLEHSRIVIISKDAHDGRLR